MDCTDEADALLLAHWQAGDTMTQIMEALNKAGYAVPSRSAIAGRKNRLASKYEFTRPGERPKRQNYRASTFIHRRRRPKAVKAVVKPVPEPVPEPEKTELFKVAPVVDHYDGVQYFENEHGCKAVLDRKGDYLLPMCCGRKRVNDGPYCVEHKKAFTNSEWTVRANKRMTVNG
jgi:hypothetical protein